MGDKKDPNVGTFPCMICGECFSYLNTAHMKTHEAGKPRHIAEYRDWVAKHSGLDREHPAIDSNQLLKPHLWRENEHLFDGWRDWE